MKFHLTVIASPLIALLFGIPFVLVSAGEQVVPKASEVPAANFQNYDASDLTSIGIPAGLAKNHTADGAEQPGKRIKNTPGQKPRPNFNQSIKKVLAAAIDKTNETGYMPVTAAEFLHDSFDDGDYTSNPTWMATSNGNGNGAEDWAAYGDPWTYSYGTVTNHGTGHLMGSNSDGGGALADEELSTSFFTDGTATLYLVYWLHFRAYNWSSEYFEVLIDGNQVDLVTTSSSTPYQGMRTVDISAYNNGTSHILTMHYYANYGYVGAFDDVVITTDITQIEGDTCDDPFFIPSLPYSDNAHNSADFNSNYGHGGPDIVYELTLTECLDITISLCSTDPVFDTYLWLYPAGDCGGTQIATDDDFCTAPDYGTSEITTTLWPNTYYIIVDSYSGAAGPYTLDIDGAACQTAPVNDDCTNALAISDGFYYVDNSYATDSGIGSHSINRDVFYCYTASTTGTCTIELCGSTFDTQVAIWDGCACPPTTEIAYNDDGCSSPNETASMVQLEVVEGQSYLIQAGSYGSNHGTINMNVLTAPITYDYLPGDINMAYGNWPAAIEVGDIAYLVSFFKGSSLSVPCNIDEMFWASADINGSCSVTSSDITRLVSYFREFATIIYCPNFIPTWPTPVDVPPTMPSGWPTYYCSAPALEPPTDTVRVWYGNPDGSPVMAIIGDPVNIDVYIQTTTTSFIGALETHLGIDSQYIDTFLTAQHQLYEPLSQWSVLGFSAVHDSPPNPPGWKSQSFMALDNVSPYIWLNSPVPTRVMTVALQTMYDPGLEGLTVPCLGIGEHPDNRSFAFADTLGIFDYPYQVNFSDIHFVTEIPGSIAGVVNNESMEPIENVIVTSLGPSSVMDYTDNFGFYSLEGLTPGIYSVMFSHPEYVDTTVPSVLVESGVITPLSLTLANLPVREPGWIYNRPRVLRDTVNAGSFSWTGVQLIDYDSVYSVIIDSVKASDEWIIVDDLRAIVINSLDSLYLPVTFDMTGYANQDMSGQIRIWHSGPDSTNVIPCEISVTAQPATGAFIVPDQNNYDIGLEPDVTGEFKIRLYNSGDLPLMITGTSNYTPWLTPVINTGIVTANAPLDLLFSINTTGLESVVLNDILTIYSSAINEPSLPINISLTVAPDSVGGQTPYGDVNFDGWCNEADVYYLRNYFMGGPAPCMPAGDVNGSGLVNGSDLSYLVNYLRGSGPPPVTACGEINSYRQHNLAIQAQLGQNIAGHRGDWVDVPVMVQNHEHYKTQIAFDVAMGIIDDVAVEDATGIGFATYATIETNTALDMNTITLADSVGSTAPVDFDSLTQIYNLRIHIGDGAPLGTHSITPADVTSERGPTMFLQADNITSLAPMFYGSTITIRPRVTIDEIIGVPDIAYLSAMRSFPLSLKITSDAAIANTMDIFILELPSGDTIYADTVNQFLLTGTHTYDFTVSWEIGTPGYYAIGAGILSEMDEVTGNCKARNILLTDDIQIGLPPAEGFGSTLLHSIGNPDNSLIVDDLPSNYAAKNEDNEIPEWEIYTGMSHDQDNNKCVHMPGYDYLGPHDDWLVYGPLTGVSLEMPVIRFWETAFNWNDTSGSTHEYYVQYASDFDIATAEAEGPILTHTPDNHGIAPLIWVSVSILLPDSIGFNDKVYFAWRYIGPEDQAKRKFDIWRVDYIEWYDSASNAYEYYPGDANMNFGIWPPAVIGSDVTYLVNYFLGRPTNPSCLVGGYYGAADINGDCRIIGSDVTRLVSYFQGIVPMSYCPDYEPAWHVPADFPPSAPAGWPNCGSIPAVQNLKALEINNKNPGERER